MSETTCKCGRDIPTTKKSTGEVRTMCIECELTDISKRYGTEVIPFGGPLEDILNTNTKPEDWDQGTAPY